MRKLLGALAATGAGAVLILAQSGAIDPAKEWPTYGHDSGGMRFSPLTEITPENVGQLKVAWTYHMRPAGYTPPPGGGRFGGGGGAVGDVPDAPQFAGGGGQGRG